MSLDFDQLTNPFIQTHLKYVYKTEPPRIFHVWAALTCVSACMQRHLYLDTGIGRLFGNFYTLLVGPPATHKNTAIKFPVDLLRKAADVKFAPDDTGDQRQGLITAMAEINEDDDETFYRAGVLDFEAITNMQINHTNNGTNRHVMFVHATEFGSFIGQNNLALTRFLIKMFDGEPYDYRLAGKRQNLLDNLYILLGATTSSDLATFLPPQAIGQGFMSRFFLVHAPHKEKLVPLDEATLDKQYENDLIETFRRTFYDMEGGVQTAPAASKAFKYLDMQEVKIHDTRFIYYTHRRQMHMRKLAMVMAIARGSMTIEEQDVIEANLLLAETELHMPDALGEYGMSSVAVAQQKVLEYLRYAKEPVSHNILWAVMRRDIKAIDFKNLISALINADKIIELSIPDRGIAYSYVDNITRTVSSMSDEALDELFADDGSEKSQQVH